MASDSTAGGAPADMPVDPDATLENEAIDLVRLVEQLQAEKTELQDKYLRAEAETQNVRRRGQQEVERERKYGIERFARDVLSVAEDERLRWLSAERIEAADSYRDLDRALTDVAVDPTLVALIRRDQPGWTAPAPAER